MQTTIINSSNAEVSYGFEACPIAPSSVIYRDETNGLSWAEGIKQSNGCHIYWNKEEVRKNCADDSSIMWIKKPTLADAVMNKHGTYYRFHSDGSVEATYDGFRNTTFRWSSEVEGDAEKGELIWTHYNQETEEYEENEKPFPCQICEKDCRGCDNEGWQLCSNDCLGKMP